LNSIYVSIIIIIDNMDSLCDDLLICILNLIETKKLIKFSLTNKYLSNAFRRNIKSFKIDCGWTKITDK